MAIINMILRVSAPVCTFLLLSGCTYTSLDEDGTRHVYALLGKVTIESTGAISAPDAGPGNVFVGETVEVTGLGVLINVGGGQPGLTLGYGQSRSTLIYPDASVLVDRNGLPVAAEELLSAMDHESETQ